MGDWVSRERDPNCPIATPSARWRWLTRTHGRNPNPAGTLPGDPCEESFTPVNSPKSTGPRVGDGRSGRRLSRSDRAG